MINGAAAHSTLFFSFLSGSLEWAGRRKEERVDALGGSKEMNEWMNKEKRMKFFLICEWAVSFVWCLMDLISFLWLLWVMAGLPAMLRNKRRKQKEIKFKSNQLAAFMKFIWLILLLCCQSIIKVSCLWLLVGCVQFKKKWVIAVGHTKQPTTQLSFNSFNSLFINQLVWLIKLIELE